MKLKLLLIAVLAFGGLAHAQGFASKLSVGAGFEGIFPAATFTRAQGEGSTNTGNLSTQDTTKSVGAVADLRYDFGHHSALDFSVTVNRNTETYFPVVGFTTTGLLNRVQTNNAELIGTYVFRLPSNEKVKPYALVGGGLVRFSPNTDFNVGITPSTETKPAFAYGFGTDFKVSDRWAIRLQYRGLIRGEPDFKLSASSASPFGTGLKTHVPEPSVELVYHF